jgi:hypothetical protein
MSYRQAVERTLRDGRKNPFGVAAVSLAASMALAPLVATLSVGTLAAVLGGLWATSLLLGVVTVAAFRLADEIARRGVRVETHLVLAGGVGPVAGLKLGGVTFLFGVPTVTGAAFASAGEVPAATVGVTAAFPVFWYLWVGLSAPELAGDVGIVRALQAGGTRAVATPLATVWFLCGSIVFGALAGLFVIVTVVFLPGTLALFAVHVARAADGGDADGGADGDHTAEYERGAQETTADHSTRQVRGEKPAGPDDA